MKKTGKISNNRKLKRKKNIKKVTIAYLVGLAILIYFVYSIIQLIRQPTDVIAIENGSLSEEEHAVGYVIREENVIQGDNYKNGMVQIKAEGERVAKGDPVFRYYSSNEETLIKKIQELDIKIQEAMASETDLFSSDMKLLENQIQEKLVQIENLNDVQKITEYKRDMNTKITKKAKIAGDLSPSGSYIRKLIEERSGYEKSLNSGSEYIKAPVSGIVSYRVDGLESVLTPESFSTLNKKLLQDLNLKTGEIISSNSESGKIINNFEGYIATSLSSEKAKEVKVGDSVKVRLSNAEEITAKIEYLIEESDSKLIVFKVTNGSELLANYRKISFDVIWWSYSGLKVPNTALLKEQARSQSEENKEDVYYIIRNRAGYIDKIPVKVLKQNSSYSIISNYDSTELKSKLDYTDAEVRQAKTIMLYDEIMINPKM